MNFAAMGKEVDLRDRVNASACGSMRFKGDGLPSWTFCGNDFNLVNRSFWIFKFKELIKRRKSMVGGEEPEVKSSVMSLLNETAGELR